MNDYLRINNLISGSDAIIIGAGAGLSTSAGINYGSEGFQENFPELVQKYGMTDMYTSSFYLFKKRHSVFFLHFLFFPPFYCFYSTSTYI